MHNKPYSQACENNKTHILPILSNAFEHCQQVLEIGSGSGQHAVHFAPHMPHLRWQTSDLCNNHHGIKQWLDEFPAPNLVHPIEVDLSQAWPVKILQAEVDGIFTANTLHIVSWPLVVNFFSEVAKNLATNGTLCIYGPFKYQGQFTTESNANFDLWLKARDTNSGVRDIEAIILLASQAGLQLMADHAMPANNQLLVFTKKW